MLVVCLEGFISLYAVAGTIPPDERSRVDVFDDRVVASSLPQDENLTARQR